MTRSTISINIMEKKLSNIIRDWVGINKKVFWKYEVSCYFSTYKISVLNLPNPSNEDIKISPNRVLSNSQKTQLCNTIKKSCAKAGELGISCIEVNVDYVNEAVTAAVI